MKQSYLLSFLIFLLAISLGSLPAQDLEKIHKEFDAREELRISSVSGDYEISKGSTGKIIVDVQYDKHLEGAFEPEFIDSGSKLRIKEEWYGSSKGGKLLFKIQVPDNMEIEFETASGDFAAEGLKFNLDASTASGDIDLENVNGEIKISTASGDVELSVFDGELDVSTASGDVEGKKVSGEIEISTASGDMEIKDSKAAFDLSCASGDIELSAIVIAEESSFSTASGEIKVDLAETSKYDLELSSASGDVTLDYNGNPLQGYYEFTAKKGRGSISGPVKFEREEVFERNGQDYERKSFSQGGKSPKILISTASGDVVLKK